MLEEIKFYNLEFKSKYEDKTVKLIVHFLLRTHIRVIDTRWIIYEYTYIIV